MAGDTKQNRIVRKERSVSPKYINSNSW